MALHLNGATKINRSALRLIPALPDIGFSAKVMYTHAANGIATTTLKKVSIDGAQDLQRLPYAAELPLEGFRAGHYVLLFTAIDRIARTNASHQIRFEIY